MGEGFHRGRRARTAVAATWLTAVLAAAGCNGKTDSETGGLLRTGPIETVEDFEGGVMRAFCHVLFTCHFGNDDLIGQTAVLETEGRCDSALARYLPAAQGEFREYRDAVARGDAHLNVDRATACVAAIGARCLGNLDLQSYGDCRGAVEGEHATGEPCFSDPECAADAYCDQTGAACPGVCQPVKPIGAPCDRDSECDAPEGGSALCRYDDTRQATFCETATFGEPAAEGAACGNLDGVVTPCAGNLWCDDTKGPPATCKKPIPVGAACTDNDEGCEHGSFCVGPDSAKTCRTVQLQRTVGATCGSLSDDASFCDVFGGFTCGEAGCEALGDGTRGTRCDSSDSGDLVPCNAGLFCSSETKTCEPLHAAGDPCQSNRECESGSCDSTAGTCRSRYCEAD